MLDFRRSLWIVGGGLFCHGVYDLVHSRFIDSAGVPAWLPVFCLAHDATAVLYLAVLLRRSTVPARFQRRVAGGVVLTTRRCSAVSILLVFIAWLGYFRDWRKTFNLDI